MFDKLNSETQNPLELELLGGAPKSLELLGLKVPVSFLLVIGRCVLLL